MRHIRIFNAVLMTTLALSGLGAASASAGLLWSVKGKILAEGVKKKVTAKLSGTTKAVIEAEFTKLSGSIECEKLELEKGEVSNTDNWAHNTNTFKFSACKTTGAAVSCKVKEPLLITPKSPDQGVVVQNVAKTKVYEDLLPEVSGTKNIFAETTLEGFFCPKIIIETSLPRGKEGGANEGEGGILAEIVEPRTEKVVHKMKIVCPFETKAALNAIGKEIKVNEIATSEKEKACVKGEADVEIEKEEWSVQ